MDRKQMTDVLLKYREKIKNMNEKNFIGQESSKETNSKEEGFSLVKANKSVVGDETFEQNIQERERIIKRERTRVIDKIGNIASLAFLTLILESLFILISIYIYQ